MARGNIVNVVNRTDRELKYMFDGQIHTLTPGENAIPEQEVRFAREQNVLMGTRDPYNPANYVSLVGVKGRKGKAGDCSAIVIAINADKKLVAMFEDGTEFDIKEEGFDRSVWDVQDVVAVKNRRPAHRGDIEVAHLHDTVGAFGE